MRMVRMARDEGRGLTTADKQTAYDVKKIEGEIPCIRRI